MEVKVCTSSEEVAGAAANRIIDQVQHKPGTVLGLATGGTMTAVYEQLVRRFQQGDIDFSRVKTFNLDEYYGLEARHPQSYHSFMHEHLFKYINVPPGNIHIPSGTPEDVQQACQEYDQQIKASGGIDLQLLGIGENGHIGFNEPGEQLYPHTHLITLDQQTIEANARYFDHEQEVPRQAISVGVGTILQAKHIILVALGLNKAQIISKMLASSVSTGVPASFLHLHERVCVVLDRQAASQLSKELTMNENRV